MQRCARWAACAAHTPSDAPVIPLLCNISALAVPFSAHTAPMEASEEGCPLQAVTAAWLEAQHAALLAQEPAPAALLLEAPVIDLACGAHAEVAAALLADPGASSAARGASPRLPRRAPGLPSQM